MDASLAALQASVIPKLPPVRRPPPLFQPISKGVLRIQWLLSKRPLLGIGKVTLPLVLDTKGRG